MANAFLLRHLVHFQARHRSGVRSTDIVFVFFLATCCHRT